MNQPPSTRLIHAATQSRPDTKITAPPKDNIRRASIAILRLAIQNTWWPMGGGR
jgi:hypothetical protein